MREAELMARDRWTREELMAFQRERVQALVAHAVTNSPYYREALGTNAAERPLSELPTLPKATMMARETMMVMPTNTSSRVSAKSCGRLANSKRPGLPGDPGRRTARATL